MYKLLSALILTTGLIFLLWDFNSETAENWNKNGEKSEGSDWVRYRPQTNKFTVLLPSNPQYAIDVVNIPKTEIKRWYEIYAAEELNGTVYLINLITYPTDYPTADGKQLLHTVVQEMVSSNLNNHVDEITDTLKEGQPAVAFHLSNQQFQVKGQAFLHDATVYLLAYTAKLDNFSDEEYNKFIDSFDLKADIPVKEGENKSEA